MENNSDFIAAIRLTTNDEGSCIFEKGKIPTLSSIKVSSFWISKHTEDWEKNIHPAPRRQYVVTLKGKIRFKVSDGSTFLIEPGVILLAEDTEGVGHSWEMEDEVAWERLYIPMNDTSENLFIPDSI
ncbi:hypothetical protein PGH12_13445 [Chryseobacterium wangxinyae]|uniref:hypothetical protein n=1 Tax=Chryseobacterium sp. CY350 TaxID=2997336 RepID=UPI00226D8347|nr:hypothetical protein [Chryseobacterium sp. CY350]MCY0975924.1 hypothetical protein [Chryseobacterium sp. CY350]WBZ94470.1 hypothetical protein PGH12_13445 [Chryseobacterium sp. CY350]